jgi:tetratricopeptide (TPR) repeat protein
LGEAYFRLGQHEQALQAFTVCLRMAPGIERARRRSAEILKVLGRPEEAAELSQSAGPVSDDEVITVVSGLPRSGTSMMMQALVAGGAVPFTDNKRTADESNPKGYFEHASVKGLAKDGRFLALAKGKVVKVVAPLLPMLPPRHRYRVVFMDRDIHEVLGSQDRMLGRRSKKGPKEAFRMGLHDSYLKQLARVEAWQAKHPNVEMIHVPYAAVIQDPATEMRRVSALLGGKLDPEAMAGAVDPALYRTRISEPAG